MKAHLLTLELAKKASIEKISLDEKTFRLMLNEDAMATEKLAEGIRGFAKAAIDLEAKLCKDCFL